MSDFAVVADLYIVLQPLLSQCNHLGKSVSGMLIWNAAIVLP